jgi:hypothetical protein
LIILPGIEAIYVLLCPLISDSSLTPPNEILISGLFNDFAIELANDVLPVPGGPTKARIVPFDLGFFCLTARYSIILSFGFSKP